jgi:hypothetical protein
MLSNHYYRHHWIKMAICLLTGSDIYICFTIRMSNDFRDKRAGCRRLVKPLSSSCILYGQDCFACRVLVQSGISLNTQVIHCLGFSLHICILNESRKSSKGRQTRVSVHVCIISCLSVVSNPVVAKILSLVRHLQGNINRIDRYSITLTKRQTIVNRN